MKLDFPLSTPWFVPNQHVGGICRFYLQEVSPNFRLYVSPINIDPSAPAVKDVGAAVVSSQDVSESTGFVLHDRLSGRPQGALERRFHRR